MEIMNSQRKQEWDALWDDKIKNMSAMEMSLIFAGFFGGIAAHISSKSIDSETLIRMLKENVDANTKVKTI